MFEPRFIYTDSVTKHGFTTGDAEWAVVSAVVSGHITTNEGSSGRIFIGPALDGRTMLEVIGEETSGGLLKIFHCMKVRRSTLKQMGLF